ncbi:SAM-dependent methyltransferase [Bradyrhizobium guangdongense]|uniref:class I SAM-dependent methyltransferase n=1 Tax=Bradyrhizobium guangdongense TaxID=1325090 RepID=UPI001126BE0A|nr:class I SAM-dependent methyltransferase [Bradyrhizobium guangdongense]TPQ27236.1 SAM-dependent methyltransferase [Bradyrhizobium guangdongense]
MVEQPDQSTPLAGVHEFLRKEFKGRNVRIYEAGGGSRSYLPLEDLSISSVTVVDIDPVQIADNRYGDQKVLGDIQEYVFPPNSFDLIVCYNVIEHLTSPDKAIELFYQALAPGGFVFIGAPNPTSLWGIAAKYTPHWFHVAAYRWILGRKDAGQPGKGPFPTIYHRIVSPAELVRFCEKLGFKTIYKQEHSSPNLQNLADRRRIFGWAIKTSIAVLNVLALGRNDFGKSDYHVVFKKVM